MEFLKKLWKTGYAFIPIFISTGQASVLPRVVQSPASVVVHDIGRQPVTPLCTHNVSGCVKWWPQHNINLYSLEPHENSLAIAPANRTARYLSICPVFRVHNTLQIPIWQLLLSISAQRLVLVAIAATVDDYCCHSFRVHLGPNSGR